MTNKKKKKQDETIPFDQVVKQLLDTPPVRITKVGSNIFTGFSIPLVVDNRHFILEPGDPPLISVAVLEGDDLLFEVFRNVPRSDNPDIDASATPVGITAVSDKETERFLYKIRPESETSIIFGRADKESTVVIKDRRIYVDGLEFRSNIIAGMVIGIKYDSSTNSIGICGKIPKELIEKLFRHLTPYTPQGE